MSQQVDFGNSRLSTKQTAFLRVCREDATSPMPEMSLYLATRNRSLHSDMQRSTSNSAATGPR